MSNILLIVGKKSFIFPISGVNSNPKTTTKTTSGFRWMSGESTDQRTSKFWFGSHLSPPRTTLRGAPKKYPKNIQNGGPPCFLDAQKRGRPVFFVLKVWKMCFFCLGRRDLGFVCCWFLFVYKEMKMRQEDFLWDDFWKIFCLGQRLGTHHLPQRPKVI